MPPNLRHTPDLTIALPSWGQSSVSRTVLIDKMRRSSLEACHDIHFYIYCIDLAYLTQDLLEESGEVVTVVL